MEENNTKQPCPQFPYFGAWYPDATCIDGFLWDLDKYEDGHLYGGGEDPCPFCNTEAFIEQHLDEENTRESLLIYVERMRVRYGSNKPHSSTTDERSVANAADQRTEP